MMMTATNRRLENTLMPPTQVLVHLGMHQSFGLSTSSASASGDAVDTRKRINLTISASSDRIHAHPILRQIRNKQYPSQMMEFEVEMSVHACARSFVQELRFIFADLVEGSGMHDKLAPTDCRIMAIPMFQHTRVDIMGTGIQVEAEKSRCLEQFYMLGLCLCLEIRERGYWADITDPVSGFPMLSARSTSYYPDVYGSQRLLGYETINCGCCNVISHPKYGTQIYPSTMFVWCPTAVLEQVLGLSLGR
eukprot:Partr_v1_DN26647_c3_g1_i1_m69348 putative Uncharacterized conserved protein (DUF2246)